MGGNGVGGLIVWGNRRTNTEEEEWRDKHAKNIWKSQNGTSYFIIYI